MNRKPVGREVKSVIPSDEVTRMTLIDTSHMAIEVRQRRDGGYLIYYPAEGWLPCVPGCDTKHSHEYSHPYTESYYHPVDLNDALEYAYALAGDYREVKVVEWVPPSQRPRRKKGDTDV